MAGYGKCGVRLVLSLAFAILIDASAFAGSLFDIGALEHSLGRGDLWRVIAYACVPSARIGATLPCSEVHVADRLSVGWATLRVGNAHILTVPTEPLSGIESAAAQAPASAQYWQAAWGARSLVERDIGHPLPRNAVGLAINSAYARSQDQFHIHTSCVQSSVRAALTNEGARIGTQWTRLQTPIAGVRYMVRRLDTPDLVDENVVDLLPASVKSGSSMARQTIVVVGATFEDGRQGFYVLNTQANFGRIHGASLLDFDCR